MKESEKSCDPGFMLCQVDLPVPYKDVTQACFPDFCKGFKGVDKRISDESTAATFFC